MKHLKNMNIVFKLSSLAVTNSNGGINHFQMNQIINDIMFLKNKYSIRPVIVSSGAINAGRSIFSAFDSSDMASLQASSSIGQVILMQKFQEKFAKQGQIISQVLLTHEDLKNKKRSLNTKNTLNKLLNENVIPILNENDTVSFDEITFGDNDQLSTMICEMINARFLILLTQANGLFDRDPENENAKRFSQIEYDRSFDNILTITKSATGKGGMKTKLQAVRKLTPLGIDVFISTFVGKNPILKAFERISGTHFQANPNPVDVKKKSWILTRVRDHAHISIDKGAMEALLKNASLLPVGIKNVSGPFLRGDSVQIKHGRKVIAYGIVEYSSKEAEKIKQCKSNELQDILGHVPSMVVIHKDNLILKQD
ncbi:MAG: glutamate 5-kinase [Gammaproteobacteria bacterium]|nr:glutamate 5-kinase [Gammaproteobacteria bacterium]